MNRLTGVVTSPIGPSKGFDSDQQGGQVLWLAPNS